MPSYRPGHAAVCVCMCVCVCVEGSKRMFNKPQTIIRLSEYSLSLQTWHALHERL